jgi:hypothetical protein
MDSDYQNSGVTIECLTNDANDTTERFYGRVEEIWELDYARMHDAMMFCVRWAKNVVRENKYFTNMSIPDAKSATVNINIIAKTEPWVHAKHVTQCFFITDPTNPSRVAMRRGKRSIVGMDGVANEEDYDQYSNPMREDDMTMKHTRKEESILHYLRKIILHGSQKVTRRGSIIRQRTRKGRSSM